MARRRPSVGLQMLILAGGIAALVGASFLADDAGDGSDGATATTVGVVTTTTGPRGFPPAQEQSVCRTLLTTEEAEALVGRRLRHPVIEPIQGNCAWPVDEGTPLDAELFLVVEERGDLPLAQQLDLDFAGKPYRSRPTAGLGDEAAYVILTGASPEGGEVEFAEGLYAHARELRIVLASGGRDIWEGGVEAVSERLRTAMSHLLDRVDARLGDGEG